MGLMRSISKMLIMRILWKIPLSVLLIIIFLFGFAIYANSQQVFFDQQFYDLSTAQLEYFDENGTYKQSKRVGINETFTYSHPRGQGYVDIVYYPDRIEYKAYGANAKEFTKIEYISRTSSTTTKPSK